jgi:hypothetical protein
MHTTGGAHAAPMLVHAWRSSAAFNGILRRTAASPCGAWLRSSPRPVPNQPTCRGKARALPLCYPAGPFAMQTAKPEGSDAVVLRAVMNYSGACATKDPKLQTLGVRCLDPACRGLTMPLTCRMRSSIFSSELCSSCASAPRRLGRRVDPSTVTTASRVSSSWMHDRCMHNQRRDT